MSRYRSDLQGLRAVAVAAVVLYHLWPNRISGGFVGVDVFFVISGYLITSHIYRDIVGKGFSFVHFWARRIRRLIPVALLVLTVSLAATYLWIPPTLWESTGRQATASALYMQNWILAADSVDYSALNAAATVSQHYWSLSIEEQFYVFWPLFMVALVWAASRVSKRSPAIGFTPRTILITGVGGLAAGSLLYSIYATAANPAAAYFLTPTRVWEFAVGALIALIFMDRVLSGFIPTVLAWVGAASIFVSALLYDSETAFPGYAALVPVIGTALIISCGGNKSIFGPSWFLSRKPVVWIGDISYAVYLWHWPLIIVVPFALDTESGWTIKLVVLTLTILLAWVTKLFLEDPLRRGSLLRGNLRAYMFTAVGMLVITLLSWGLTALANAPTPDNHKPQSTTCYGPGALDPANDCTSITGERPDPSTVSISKQNSNPPYPGCQANFAGTELVTCVLGASGAEAKTTVAIVGDSHATSWFPAMDLLGKKYGWRVETYTKSSCPVTSALRVLDVEKSPENQSNCHEWSKRLEEKLTTDKEISTIFTAAYSSAYTFESADGDSLADPAMDGFMNAWAIWQAAGKKVVVFDDVPRTNGQSIPTCLENQPSNSMKCALPVDQAVPANMNITNAAAAASADKVSRVSLGNQFCDQEWCYPMVGSLIVYRDYSHLSAEYAQALVPQIETQLAVAGIL